MIMTGEPVYATSKEEWCQTCHKINSFVSECMPQLSITEKWSLLFVFSYYQSITQRYK